MFDPASERVVMLNRTAGDVWRLSDGEHGLEEIVALLAVASDRHPRAVSATLQAQGSTLSRFCLMLRSEDPHTESGKL